MKIAYRAVGRIKGISPKPLNHGDTITLDSDEPEVEALVAAGALVPASQKEETSEGLGYSTSGEALAAKPAGKTKPKGKGK